LGAYNAQGVVFWKAPVTRLDPSARLNLTNDGTLWAHNDILTPRIKVFITKGTSASAVNAVANIYTEMMKRLVPAPSAPDPKRKFDGFKVYITNNESWDVQSKLPVVGTMWPDKTGPMSGRVLQGGASDNFLWLSEQMIAKKGVKIRADDRPSSP
jgi:hypothetical protein